MKHIEIHVTQILVGEPWGKFLLALLTLKVKKAEIGRVRRYMRAVWCECRKWSGDGPIAKKRKNGNDKSNILTECNYGKKELSVVDTIRHIYYAINWTHTHTASVPAPLFCLFKLFAPVSHLTETFLLSNLAGSVAVIIFFLFPL